MNIPLTKAASENVKDRKVLIRLIWAVQERNVSIVIGGHGWKWRTLSDRAALIPNKLLELALEPVRAVFPNFIAWVLNYFFEAVSVRVAEVLRFFDWDTTVESHVDVEVGAAELKNYSKSVVVLETHIGDAV